MNELYHYGVLGMRWGVRRSPAQLGRGQQKKQPFGDSHDDYRKAHDKKSVNEMSDKELRERVNRLNMEQQYSRLNRETVRRGKNYAEKIFKAGKIVADVTNTALTLYGNYERIRKILNSTK